MFDSHFLFSQIGSEKHDGDHERTLRYKFKISNKKSYYVEVEKFKHSIYVVKYYPLDFEKDKKYKYNRLTNDYMASKVIGTCIKILTDIYSKDSIASFGFIGSFKVGNDNKKEDEANSQRYRVYAKLSANVLSSNNFHHFSFTEKSAYLLLNKKHPDTNYVIESAKEMFNRIYELDLS